MSVHSIVLGAGQGTRMKGSDPKSLRDICGWPMCFWPLTVLENLDENQISLVIGHGAEKVKNVVSQKFGDTVEIIIQEQQLGTGHAVQVALEKTQMQASTVLVMCADTPLIRSKTLKALVSLRTKSGAQVAMLTATLESPGTYGRVVRDSSKNIEKVVEFHAASASEKEIREINTGIYAFDADFLSSSIKKLSRSNQNGELLLPDLVQMAAEEGSVLSMSCDAEEMRGANTLEELYDIQKIAFARIAKFWQSQGVSFQDLNSTFVDADCTLSEGVHLSASVHLRGSTQIEGPVCVDVGCIISDSTIEPFAEIKPYCVLEEAFVGEKSVVGPFARLRPGAELQSENRVGNFVEIKNTKLGPGTKANHLAYIGDTETGEKCNIGAGTITCNYDGYEKHKTILGNGVFIGSNSTLVAPINIGDGAYGAAGSTLTKSVPENALAVGRGRQENKEGYAEIIRLRAEKSRQ